MKRRDFLKLGTYSSAGLVAGNISLLAWTPRAYAAHLPVNLEIISGFQKMIDNKSLYMFSFSGLSADGKKITEFPGPTLICQEGDTIDVKLTNTLSTHSSFMVAGTDIAHEVAPGRSIQFSFAAPAAGSYLYHDGLNNGVNRVMGLHGALIVMPAGKKNISFNGGPDFVRQYKWLLGNVDPNWSHLVNSNGDDYVTQLSIDQFEPKYFTLNGASYHDTHTPDTELMGAIGEAALVRMINAGLAVHSLHFHGNHVEVASINRQNFSSHRKHKDVISMFPEDARDAVIPFEVPRDIPPQEFKLGFDIIEHPQHYPMHCHTELSQTAGGGFYPHGMHTGIVIGQSPETESEVTQGMNSL